jgi:hypothetical protein
MTSWKPHTPFVVKVQRALFPPGGPVLVYDQARSFAVHLPWTEVKRRFKPDELKVFCRAEFTADGALQLLDGRVNDPGW